MSRACFTATWQDVPHLSDEAKAEYLMSVPMFQRKARSQGIPELGRGVVYPVAIEDLMIPDFPVPKTWKRAYGLDVGWNCTAGVFIAYDLERDRMFVYDVYKRGEVEPGIHVQAIRQRGSTADGRLWLHGVLDPAARGRSQADGKKLLDIYRGLGLSLSLANNAVESGITEVWTRLSSGRLKVFQSCAEWFAEFSNYHRKEGGVIVKENDHLMDATRYAVMSGGDVASPVPSDLPAAPEEYEYMVGPGGGSPSELSWMGG